jgi:hypothetical protein
MQQTTLKRGNTNGQYLKKCSTPLAIKEMQIKMTPHENGYHQEHEQQMLQGCRKKETLHTVVENVS